MEIWKEIKDYAGYEVSNLGNVKSKNKVLKPRKTQRGYYQVVIYKDKKAIGWLLHRVVAKAFIPNPNNLPIVMHLDDNGFNNKVENLKWGTISENTQDAFNKGLIKLKK